MTDLYEALRAAVTPDGRVRLTRELLTAMHEEGERRSRVDDAMQSPTMQDTIDAAYHRGYADRDMLLRERAETAERELAEMRADRDSWRQQCEDARGDALRYGRERDEALARIKAAGDVVSDNGCDCACDHSTLHEDHDEDCEVCVVCRVADALWPEAGR